MGALPGGWAVDDCAALLFRDRELVRVVASKPGPGAAADRSAASERELEAELLGSGPAEIGSMPVDIAEYRLHRRAREG